MKNVLRFAGPAALAALSACAGARGPALPSPADQGRRLVAPHGAVASANALASEAGVEVLEAGGNAVDAAVATAFAIGVVEPQMSGLGAGGAAVVWLARERRAYDLDFYSRQNAESFRGHTASPYAPGDLRVVGIPGDVAGLLALQQRFGRLPRARVMAPAIRLAQEGFPVGDILAQMIRADSLKLKRSPEAWARFWPGGRPLAPGTVVRNPELAATLGAVAAGGGEAFYRGPVAEHVLAVLNAGGHPARVADLAGYPLRWQRPLCADYHGLAVLSAAPPQTGLQVLHTLQLLATQDLPAAGLPTRSARAFDIMASALRVGMADTRGNDDPDWTPVPAAGIVSAAFARARAGLVGTGTVPDSVAPAAAAPFDSAPPPAACRPYEPYGPARPVSAAAAAPDTGPGVDFAAPGPSRAAGVAPVAGPDDVASGGETTHVSVVDRAGNAVALTQTNSSVFGSGAWVDGFFLNDSGARFTEEATTAPRSPWRTRTTTIAPTIVLADGRVRMVVGAPGGGRIPTEIVQVMSYVLDYGLDPLDAVRMPRIYPSPRARRVQLEHGFPPALLRDVAAMGWELVPPAPEYARLYLIVRAPGGWIAVSDPRHDGEPRGY